MFWNWLFVLTQFCANDELAVCRNELRNLGDRIQLSILEHPSWRDVFQIQERDVADILHELADKLEDNFKDCPCIGSCTSFKDCVA
jgi:hypothetical protein